MKFGIYPILLTTTLFTNLASAALIDNNIYTTDTATGLDWLDLTQTVNTDYSLVESQMGAGGQFEGWTLATPDQVITLLGNAGGNGIYDGTNDTHDVTSAHFDSGWSTENNGVVAPLLDMWGNFSTDPQNHSAHVIFDEQNAFGNYTMAYLFDTTKASWGLTSDLIEITTTWSGTASTQVGAALVRPSAVPLPAAVWLFGTGLLTLLGFAHKRKSLR